MSNEIDPHFFDVVSQIAHTSVMYGINFTVGVFFRRALWVTVPLCVVYALIHEFVWDPREENPATRGSDTEDFIFLCLGTALGAVMARFA